MFIKCKLWRSLLCPLFFPLLLSPHLAAIAEESDEGVMACENATTGQISYRSAAEAEGDSSCRKLASTGGTFNQVKSFEGYRASLEAEGEDTRRKQRSRKDRDSDEASEPSEDRGKPALTSFEFDELQSKKNSRKTQCHVEGETKVRKGCRVEIELIRGALTTVSFSRLGRSSSNTVKWKRVLEGECRDLTVRAVGSGCD
jgi:hypothetical protein